MTVYIVKEYEYVLNRDVWTMTVKHIASTEEKAKVYLNRYIDEWYWGIVPADIKLNIEPYKLDDYSHII